MTTYGQGQVGPGGLTYGDRISKLKGRLDDKGANRQKLRGRISDLRAQRSLTKEKKQPDPMLPFNAEYDTTVSGAARNRDISLQNNAYERQMAQTNYGFDNPLANPYSKAALLQRSFDQHQRGTINSQASAGMLYDGSTQTSLDNGMFNFGADYNAARSEYDQTLRSITDKDLAAQTGYGDTVQQAEAKRLADALQEGIDPNAAPDRSKNVQRYIRSTRKDIRKAQKSGRDNQADKLRAKLKKLGVGSGR